MEGNEAKIKNFQNKSQAKSQQIFREILSEMDPGAETLDLSKLVRTINLNEKQFKMKEYVKKMFENYQATNTILTKENMKFDYKLSEKEFCDFITGQDLKQVLYERNLIQDKGKIEEIINLYHIMGGDKDGISVANLDKSITKVVKLFAKPDAYLGDNYDPDKEQNNFKGDAQEIINLLGQTRTDKLTLEDFVNIMTGEFNADFDNIAINVPENIDI